MRYFPYCFAGIFVLAGLVIAVFGLVALGRAQRSARWAKTDGHITRSEVVVDGASYAPAVVYSYTVAGAQYQGTDITCGAKVSSGDGAYARACTARYQVGAPVAVYFDPDEPTAAVLEPGISRKSFIPLVFGLGFASFGAWFCLMFWLFEV
jgi:hypothetical protein